MSLIYLQRDSGAPLVCKNAANEDVLSGVAILNLISMSDATCAYNSTLREPTPNIYADVAEYVEWIEMIGNGSDSLKISSRVITIIFTVMKFLH